MNVSSPGFSNDNFSVTVSNEPEIVGEVKISNSDLQEVVAFVVKNQALLLQYWNNELYTDDFFDKMQPM